MPPEGPDSPHVNDLPPDVPDPALVTDVAAVTEGPDPVELDEINARDEPDDPDAPDGPDAARGPHLPDRWPALVFLVLGVAVAWYSYQQAARTGATVWAPQTIFAFLLNVIPSVAAVLLPGALLLRHPDAIRRARTLLFGTLLLAAVPFLRLVEDSLQGLFTTLTPAPDDLGYVPLALLYNVLQALVALFAVLYLVLGLSQTRHWASSRGARAAGFVILAVGVVTAGAMFYTTTQTDLSGIAMNPMLWIYFGSSTVVGLLTILTWAYLGMTLTRGAMSGEEPGAAWFVAAIGSCLIVMTFAIGAWSSFLRPTDESLQSVIFWTHGILYSLGYLGLLAGFALGLPSLDPVEWDDEDAEAADAENDGGDEAEDEDEGAEDEGAEAAA